MSMREELEEEAGILDLACGQLGNELAQGRIRAAESVLRRLEGIVRRLKRLDALAKESTVSSLPVGKTPDA